MNVRLLVGWGSILEVLKIGLAQAEMIPSPLWEILQDFPLLAIFGGAIYLILKWLVRMLEDQRAGLRDIYEGNSKFIKTLLEQAERKQDNMQASIDKLSDEVRILRATLSEVANMNDVVERLLEEVREK